MIPETHHTHKNRQIAQTRPWPLTILYANVVTGHLIYTLMGNSIHTTKTKLRVGSVMNGHWLSQSCYIASSKLHECKNPAGFFHCVCSSCIITRTSLISLGRTHELCLCGIFQKYPVMLDQSSS